MAEYQPSRLFEVLHYQHHFYPQGSAIGEWTGSRWITYSTVQCLNDIYALAQGIKDKAWSSGERVGILSQLGSYAWIITDAALQMCGLIPVPLHASAQERQFKYIFTDADIKRCFVANYEMAGVLRSSIAELSRPVDLYSFEPEEELPHWRSLQTEPSETQRKSLDDFARGIAPDALATIIYTSGTTGDPKGVMLSHKNILSNILSTLVLIPVNANDKALSYLPMSHIFERMVIYSYLMTGTCIYFAKSVNTILEDLQQIRPNYFTSVPRLLERVYERIMLESRSGNILKQRLIKWAIRLGEQHKSKPGIKLWYGLQKMLADLLVYRHWRRRIGGRVKGVIVGAAALQPQLGRLFSAAGIQIREGYGLTETSPVISFNRFEPGSYAFGTVGIPIPGIELRIADPDEQGVGEVQVRGPSVMMGYYRKPELTAKVIDKEGWFSTGDTGKMVQKRFLQITGRKKDLFKTTTGKYVAPFHVENILKANIFISQCLVLGANKPYPGALIIPNFDRLQAWCRDNEVHWTSAQFMVINPKVIQLYQQLLQKQNRELSKEERVRRFYLLHEEWSVASGEYGPTLKPIRAFIREKFKKQIEEMFSPKGISVST